MCAFLGSPYGAPAHCKVPGARPGLSRGAGRAAKSRAIRGVLLFGSFFLDKQEKATCRGSATHKYTPPAGRLDRVGLGQPVAQRYICVLSSASASTLESSS